ncbi:MAG TPA: hypothetical protein VGO80_00105 [Solirubrobacteraceae bacterium]|jgi:hypothetical protein|nr:hypothetical protein [Solirubrobacteraceae bacterium]
MSSLLNVDVEILKLARLVGAQPQDLAYLRNGDPQDIRDLREQVTVVMFDADRQMLQRVAATTRLIPSKLAAVIGERAFGPLLCARLTGLLEPSRAVDIAAKLPTAFLADLALELDPRRASRVVAEIPPGQIAQITKVLAEREEHVVMGGFVGHLSEAALRAAIGAVSDEALLRTAYVVQSKGSLGALVATLPRERLEQIIATAAGADLWVEALDVLGHVSERQRGELGDIAAGQPDAVLDSMVRTAQRELLWDDVLPVTRAMSPESRARFARLKSIHTRPVLASIVDAASRHALWPELLQLLPLLPAAARRRVAALGTGFGRPVLAQIVGAAHGQELWGPLMQFATELEHRTQALIAKLLASSDDEILDGMLDAVWELRLEPELARLASRLPAAGLAAFCARLLARGGEEFVVALREAAQEHELQALTDALAPA